MPKQQIELTPGQPVSSDLQELLLRYFNPAEVDKLKRLGGRVLISLSAPYKRPRSSSSKFPIDEAFVQQLRSEKENTGKLRELLEPLTTKELKQLCGLLGQPIRSKIASAEIKAEIIGNLRAEDFWRRISSVRLQPGRR